MVKKVLDAVNGSKTNIGIVAWGLYQMLLMWKPGVGNVLNPDLVNTLITMWLGYSVRDAWKKLEK